MIELSRDLRALLLECPTEGYFVAAELAWSRPGPTGQALSRLVERGLLERSSDPSKWGRSRYTFTLLGLRTRAFAALPDPPADQTDEIRGEDNA